MRRQAMPTWQDRITNRSEPATRVERELRYRYAAPAIASAKLWCDLGATGAVEVPDGFAGEILFVNAADPPQGARTLRADLNTQEGVAAVAAELQGDGVVVTCFGVIERLATFVPLLEMLDSLKKASVLLSVPNDALAGGPSAWGEGAFAELRSLLPVDHSIVAQLALAGSSIGAADGRAPTHFIAAWGVGTLDEARDVVAVDLAEQHGWVRRQEADLAYYRAAYEELHAEHDALVARLHELEQRPRELPAP